MRGLNSIQPEEAYNLVKTMALPEVCRAAYRPRRLHQGRTLGGTDLKQWGLKPINKQEGYLQDYPSPYVIVDHAEMSLLTGQDQKREKLRAEVDFLPMLASDSGENTAAMVFAGWGIHAPELGYDDYAGLDVQGKFVLCFRGTPDRQNEGYQKHDHHRHRMQTAKDRGALGLFYIYSNPLGQS